MIDGRGGQRWMDGNERRIHTQRRAAAAVDTAECGSLCPFMMTTGDEVHYRAVVDIAEGSVSVAKEALSSIYTYTHPSLRC